MKILITPFILSILFTASNAFAEVDLTEYQGKVVYVDFWASWCKPCRDSFPWMNKMNQKYGKDGIEIIAVNVDKNMKEAQLFLEENEATFKVIFEPHGETAQKFGIKGMPSSVLFDREGKPTAAHTGFFKSKTKVYEAEIIKTINQGD